MSTMTSSKKQPTVELLKEIPPFATLPEATLAALCAYFDQSDKEPGEVLWQEGDESDFTAIILSGQVEEKKGTEFDNKQFVVGVYGKGALLGVNSLLDKLPRPLTAVSLAETRLLTLSHNRFTALQQEQPVLAFQLLKWATSSLSIRLNKAFERLAAIF